MVSIMVRASQMQYDVIGIEKRMSILLQSRLTSFAWINWAIGAAASLVAAAPMMHYLVLYFWCANSVDLYLTLGGVPDFSCWLSPFQRAGNINSSRAPYSFSL